MDNVVKTVADAQSANATKAKRVFTAKRRNGLLAAIRGAKTKDEFQFANESFFSMIQGQKAPERVKDPKTGKITTQRTGRRKSSARYVVMELIRAATEFMHGITSPMPPKHLYGVAPEDLADWYDDMRKKAKKGIEEYFSCKGKKCFRPQRDATVIMIGAVFSYPGLPDEDDPRFVQWRKETIEFIKRHYGAMLVTIIAHDDENCAHIHAIAALDGKPIKHLTIGNKNAWDAEKAGAKGAEITKAYKQGCVDWQDKYFHEVCEPIGLKRKGDKKQYHKPLNEARNLSLDKKELELLEDAEAVLKRQKSLDEDQISIEQADAEVQRKAKAATEAADAIARARAELASANMDIQRRDVQMQAIERSKQSEAERMIADAMAKAAYIIAIAEKQASDFLAASREGSSAKQLQRALEAALGTLDGEQRFLATSAAQKAFRGVQTAPQ